MSPRAAAVVSVALLAVLTTPATLVDGPVGGGPVVAATVQYVFSADATTGRTVYLGHRVDGGPLVTPPAGTEAVYRADPRTGRLSVIARRQSDGTLAPVPR